jgi:hypothetical protein
MSDVSLSCPRCGGEVRPPDLMHSEWRCDRCGEVPPLHVPRHISADLLASVADRVRASRGDDGAVSLWCPWPLLPGWTVTGVGWVGDDRDGVRATALALSGPGPLADGPADAVLVAEEMGVGLGTSLAGIAGPDPGPALNEAAHTSGAHAKVKAAGHPTPLWAVASAADRSVYVGEARGMWLYVIAWPASAGYLLAEDIVLHDLADAVPSELVFGAPSRRLRPGATPE